VRKKNIIKKINTNKKKIKSKKIKRKKRKERREKKEFRQNGYTCPNRRTHNASLGLVKSFHRCRVVDNAVSPAPASSDV
jgi:hypothetical protein